jgi:hypothetical protein
LLERLASLASGVLSGQAALIAQPNSIHGLSLVRRKSQAAAKKHGQGPKRYDCLDCPSHSIHLHLNVLKLRYQLDAASFHLQAEIKKGHK